MRVTTPLVVGGMVYAVAWLSMDQAGWWGGVITCTTDGVRRQGSLDRMCGLKKGEFLAHRNVHRSEDETANSIIEGAG
jgi:hypothetical protein